MVKAFAPVNIAWIKYMGKENGRPTNASLSLTLEGVGTTTEMKILSREGDLRFQWASDGYVPPVTGQEKAERFLKAESSWLQGLRGLGFEPSFPKGLVQIRTRNNVPAGTGIATSASGFAALTLAWVGVLVQDQFDAWKQFFHQSEAAKRVLADIASRGSGSACRSLSGPWVEWDPQAGISTFTGAKERFTDFILLIDSDQKAVSSSEAHLRVLGSPRFSGRISRAEGRLQEVKSALAQGNFLQLQKTVLDEAIDMHELFHTSEPSFSYLKPRSREWIRRIVENDRSLPSSNAILTLDAGANVHLFVPEKEESQWEAYLRETENQVSFIKAKEGHGAAYAD